VPGGVGAIDGRYQGREILVPKKRPMGAKSSGYGRNPVYARDKSASRPLTGGSEGKEPRATRKRSQAEPF